MDLNKISKSVAQVELLKALNAQADTRNFTLQNILTAQGSVCWYLKKLYDHSPESSEIGQVLAILRELIKPRASKWATRGPKALDKQISKYVQKKHASKTGCLQDTDELYLLALKAERQKMSSASNISQNPPRKPKKNRIRFNFQITDTLVRATPENAD